MSFCTRDLDLDCRELRGWKGLGVSLHWDDALIVESFLWFPMVVKKKSFLEIFEVCKGWVVTLFWDGIFCGVQ